MSRRWYRNAIRSSRGLSINDVTHLGGGGSAKRWHYSISLFSKMGNKGGVRGQKSQKMSDIIHGQSHMKTWKIKHSKRGKKHISENVVCKYCSNWKDSWERVNFKMLQKYLRLITFINIIFFWKLLYHVCCRCFCSHAYFLTKKASSGQVEAPYIIESWKIPKKCISIWERCNFFHEG